jgi:hypothetical protein
MMTIPATQGAARSPRDLHPARLLLILFLGQIALYLMASLVFDYGTLRLRGFGTGDDFHFFYGAAGYWLSGASPYLEDAYVTPPPAMLPAALLHRLPMQTALLVFNLVTLPLMFAGLWKFGKAMELSRRNRLLYLAVAATFPPLWMTLNGGNVDGLMLALLLFAYAARRRITRAVLLACSIVVKVYSALMVVVLLRKREFAVVGLIAAVCLLALLPFWRLWPETIHALLFRTQRQNINFNISPAELFFFLFRFLGPVVWKVLYAAFWFGTFAYTLVRRGAAAEAESLAVFAPWMVSAPLLVFSYVGIIALPALALLLRTFQDRPLRRPEWLMIVGFLLLGFHPEFVANYWTLSFLTFAFLRGVVTATGCLGTSLLVIGATAAARADSRLRSGA